MRELLKLGNILAKKGEKIQGFVEIYETGVRMPVTLINGEKDGKTILITAGVHGAEYPGIQTVVELAREIDPKDIKGNIIFIHVVNVQAFEKKVSAIVPADGKNINRVFPGKKDGTLAEQIAHFITNECQEQSDFYIDLHGGDLYEQATDFVYYPGFGSEDVLNYSKEIASRLNVAYMVKSGAKTGAYNSAAINGTPSLLIESGGRGAWSQAEVYKYKNNIKILLNSLNVYTNNGSKEESSQPKDITRAIYLESDISGFWYPEVEAGEVIEKGQFLGVIKDFFGEVINRYYAEIDGVVLYMTVTLSVENSEPLIAYGEI